MLKKVVSLVATLGVGVSIFGSNVSLAETYTDNKVYSSQYKTALKKYQEKEEVQLANKVKQLELGQIKSQKKTLTKSVKQLSDEEFIRFIHNFVTENPENTKQMKNKLNSIGVELTKNNQKSINMTAIKDPAKIPLKVYSSKRVGQNFWYLITTWNSREIENNPASLDVVSLEWNPAYGKFYAASVPNDGITTKRDGSKRDKGLYLFNVNDSKILFDSYASVQVTKKKTGNLGFGSKYTHTYSVTTKTGTGQAGINIDTTGPSGGYSYSVTKQTNTERFYIFDEDFVYLK
ncbi:hypothetical protein [Priestia aryabhattai]